MARAQNNVSIDEMGDTHVKLARMLHAGKFEPYVWYVRFPRYKNLRPDTHIDFKHPITAIVGPNGVNKTSVLRALFGVPEGMSTGTYWFLRPPMRFKETELPAFMVESRMGSSSKC